MFLILRLIRILLPVLKDHLEDRKENREKANRNEDRDTGEHALSGDPLEDTMSAYRRGDYRGAYEAAAGLAAGRANGGTEEADFFRGAMLLAEGRLNEAEPLLRQYLTVAKDPLSQAAANALLGELLIEHGNYDEAAGCLQTGMTLAPDQSAPLRQMAVVALRQGMEPEMALNFAVEAVNKERAADQARAEKAMVAEARAAKAAELEQAGPASPQGKKKFPWQKSSSAPAAVAEPVELAGPPSTEFRSANMAESLAALAWAVAASGQDESEVDKLVTEALPLTTGKGVSTRGEVHFHAACAYAEIGAQVKSTRHFTQAATADPNGRWGKQAKNMLMAASRR